MSAARNDLYVHLNALSRMGHLFVRLWFVSLFWFWVRKHPQPSHHAKQAFRTTCIAASSQTMPQFDHAQRWISAAHVTNELQFGFRVLIWMTVRAVWTGRPGMPRFHPSAASRSRCTTGFCCTFRLARLTPYFSAYFIRDCRYAMSCVILLLMRDMVSFRKVVVW